MVVVVAPPRMRMVPPRERGREEVSSLRPTSSTCRCQLRQVNCEASWIAMTTGGWKTKAQWGLLQVSDRQAHPLVGPELGHSSLSLPWSSPLSCWDPVPLALSRVHSSSWSPWSCSAYGNSSESKRNKKMARLR